MNILINQHFFMLTASVLMYILGGGIAHYLGADVLSFEFWLGLLWVISVQIAGYLLLQNFSLNAKDSNKNLVTIFFNQKKISILTLSMLLFAVSGVYLAILIVNNRVTIYIGTLFALTLLGLIALVIPPFELASKGYQEIAIAIFQGCLIPAFSFFLLFGNSHRLLLLIVFPMTLIAIAYYIAMDYSTFALDESIGRMSFIRILTWQRATPIHHILLISSYLFFLFGYGLGAPSKIFFIALLTLPLAGFQIFWLQRIVQGAKPIWSFFNVLSGSVFNLTAYFIALTLWTQ